MTSCGECGNSQLRTRSHGDHTVTECQLCGALSGDRRGVRAAADARDAVDAGVDPLVYPLVRALSVLDGLRVAGSGGVRDLQAPFVALQLVETSGLAQIENLAKSLRLQRALELDWRIEVDFETTLTFVLRPRSPSRPGDFERLARRDVEAMAAAVERDSRLSWWRRPP